MAGLLIACSLGGCRLEKVTGGTEGQFVRWLDTAAAPLAALEPAPVTSDLSALEAILGSAQVVAMGEATNGSHEFMTLKHRVLRRVVEEMDFKAVLIEASMADVFPLDRYVRGGTGTLEVALSHLYDWRLNTAEMRDALAWLREYNTGKPPAQQVGLYGFDNRFPATALDSVLRYVDAADPDSAQAVHDFLSCVRPYLNDDHGRFAASLLSRARSDQEFRVKCLSEVDTAHRILVSRRSAMLTRTSVADYDIARQLLTVVQQWTHEEGCCWEHEQSLDDNAEFWLQRLGSSTRVLLWSDDSHVGGRDLGLLNYTLGYTLKRKLRDRYIAIGLAFDGGEFNAVRTRDSVLGPVTAGALSGTAESVLRQVHDLDAPVRVTGIEEGFDFSKTQRAGQPPLRIGRRVPQVEVVVGRADTSQNRFRRAR
jgi:erythromycin esterase